MAIETGAFKDVGSQLIERLISGSIIVFLILVSGGIIMGVLWYVKYLRQFNIKVEIKSLRGSGTKGEPIYKIIPDWGGMIYDKKDKRHYFKLLREKVELPPPPLDCLELQANGRNQLKIFQKSQEEYYYLLPEQINLENVIRGGKKIPVGRAELSVIEGDIAYWNTLRKRDNRKLFDTETLLLKILPYVGIFLMFITVIFLTYIISDHWGTFNSAAQALREAAFALRDTSVAQVVEG